MGCLKLSYSENEPTLFLSANNFGVDGKERGSWLDFGARMYDPTIARWMSVDPLSELSRRWSPYTFVYNNPMVFVDPDGMFGDYYTEQGKYLGSDGIDDQKVYTADKATTTTTKDAKGNETTTTTFDNSKEIGKVSDFVDMNGKTISSDETKKDLVGLAIYLRNEEGIEGAQVKVEGGDRDAAKNKKVGGSSTSPHMAGVAADISVSGMANDALAIAAGNSGLFTGVIYYPNAGDTNGFGTHIEQKEGQLYWEKFTYNATVTNYQNLPAHVHVDNRNGTDVNRMRYAGDTSKDKTRQSGTYVPWVSNSQIK
jgi:RHS repeat-associated protein